MEALAREKFACPACGAEAHWNPARQALVCGYCGTVAPMEAPGATGEIKERDLAAALRDLPDEKRGWKSQKTSVRCQSCQAISVLDPERVAQRCEFCGSAQIIPYEQIKPPISPESLLPFTIAQAVVRESIRRWYKSRWFAPNRLKTAALTDTVRGVYLPYWTFDAQVQAHWTAQSGYYYYTTETYRDGQGKTQTRQVRHVRWQSSSGNLSHFFDDELVPASRGLHADLLRKIEPFPTKQLAPYAPSYVAGWLVEQYQLDLIGAAQHSRDRMDRQIHSMCASQVPGDTHRNLRVSSHYANQTFKHVLLPVWFVHYNYGSKTYQVLVNGVTGGMAGEYPRSFWKIFFLVLALLMVALIVFAMSR
jgi:transcription elongation factor Elf1